MKKIVIFIVFLLIGIITEGQNISQKNIDKYGIEYGFSKNVHFFVFETKYIPIDSIMSSEILRHMMARKKATKEQRKFCYEQQRESTDLTLLKFMVVKRKYLKNKSGEFLKERHYRVYTIYDNGVAKIHDSVTGKDKYYFYPYLRDFLSDNIVTIVNSRMW